MMYDMLEYAGKSNLPHSGSWLDLTQIFTLIWWNFASDFSSFIVEVQYSDPHFEEVRGGIEPSWMARWKARAESLLSVIELLFYLLRLRRYKAKCVKTRCIQEWVGYLEPKFQGMGSSLGNILLVSTKLDTFCYPTVQTAPCNVGLGLLYNTSTGVKVSIKLLVLRYKTINEKRLLHTYLIMKQKLHALSASFETRQPFFPLAPMTKCFPLLIS